MLEPLLAIDRPRRGSLLDIGCGFGFVPHFWKTSGFGKAVGLEMSRYGKIGSEKLGIDIIPLYYSEAEDLKNQKFEYVFSSEVIEHVESPEAFVKEISQALSDDGILVLTTPSSSALTKAANYIETLAIFLLHSISLSRQEMDWRTFYADAVSTMLLCEIPAIVCLRGLHDRLYRALQKDFQIGRLTLVIWTRFVK